MATKQHQIIAVEGSVRQTAETMLTDAHHQLQQARSLNGLVRTYQPFEDDERNQMPAESAAVLVTADDVIETVNQSMIEWFDVVATKDFGNLDARADVTVDGKIILKGAPVPFLLWLEKRLVNLRTFVAKLPRLDPSTEWEPDPVRGGYTSKPEKTIRTKKTRKVLIKYEATDKHPAQTEVYDDDVPVGTWTTIKLSGALPQPRIAELLERVETLQKAVKFARQEANEVEVKQQRVGKAILDYVFAD